MNDRHRQILTVEGSPYMQWAVEDVLTKRIAIAQLHELGMGSQEEIAAAFGISTKSVYNYIQMVAAKGSSGLTLRKQGPKVKWKINAEVRGKILYAFLREEIVSDFSEIEVQYSLVNRDRKDRLYSVEPNVSIGKTINITPGISRIEELNIYHLSGRWRATPHEQTAFKIIPQAAVTQEQEWAHDYQLITSHKRFSLNAGYSGFSDSFAIKSRPL